MADARQLSRVFKVLSVDTRVRLVQLLKGRTLCVKALADRLGVSAAAVSQHLRVLRDADLVTGEKRGYYVHYRVNPRTLRRWRDLADGLLGEEDIEESARPRAASGTGPHPGMRTPRGRVRN